MTVDAEYHGPSGPVPDRAAGVDAVAADGRVVRIRPVRADDAAELSALYARAGAETLYRRFFVHGRGGIPAEVASLTRPPASDHATLVIVESGQITGVASYEVDSPGRAEFAVFIDDAAHDRGLGTLLLEHLVVLARRTGVAELIGEVLPVNHAMLQVAANLGQPIREAYDGGVVEVRLSTAVPESDALDRRDVAAVRRSLAPLLAPACVAVVGAGRAPSGIGHAVLTAIAAGGFTGTLYAINPGVTEVAGIAAYPAVSAAPVRPDLIVVAVPADRVPAVIEDATAAGVPAAVILSSGFGETGEPGRAAQAELLRIARSGGMRLVGPNCLGILNTDPAVRLHATFAAPAAPGGLAVASQSGAVGISLLEQLAHSGLGVASFVSLGNKADVSGNDLLSYWYDDAAAHGIALYLESLGNPRRFARIARLVGRRKPVFAVKSGRTSAGSRAGASHTAAAAAPDATVDALFAQAGVIRCDGLRDLVDAARMLVDQPLPAGARVGIVGNAGGINVLCADAAETDGLSLPTLPGDVTAAIRAAAPAAASVSNPVDLGAAATPTAMTRAITTIAPHVDAIVVAFGATRANDVTGIVSAISAAVDAVTIPVGVVLMGVDDAPPVVGQRRAPVFALPEDAIHALGHAVRYSRWRATPLGRVPQLSTMDSQRARTLVDKGLAGGAGWLDAGRAAELVTCYGIPVAAARVVDTAAAAAAAVELGFPVVLKAGDPNLVHKSDIGGVRLGLADARGVDEAYGAIVATTGDPRVVVAHQEAAGLEMVAGIAHDPVFGSVVMCGLGGIHTDLFRDRALRLLPITDYDAASMWRGLRAAPLLTGFRGSPPVDIAAWENLLLRLGRLAEDLPEVAELDANPVIVRPDGVAVVDIKIRLAAPGVEPDPSLRALRGSN
jgi:acyl-CoA synthetase (NDP forming)/GNAT superfamily N-acetyltransferase